MEDIVYGYRTGKNKIFSRQRKATIRRGWRHCPWDDGIWDGVPGGIWEGDSGSPKAEYCWYLTVNFGCNFVRVRSKYEKTSVVLVTDVSSESAVITARQQGAWNSSLFRRFQLARVKLDATHAVRRMADPVNSQRL